MSQTARRPRRLKDGECPFCEWEGVNAIEARSHVADECEAAPREVDMSYLTGRRGVRG